MDTPAAVNTSFIPKRTIQPQTVMPKKHPVSIFIFLATILFFAALAALGGAYFWKVSIEKEINVLQAKITANQAKVDMQKVADIQALDRKLTAANKIVNEHQLVVPIFTALQELTLKTIRYTRFSVSSDPQSKEIKVVMSGQSAGGYTPIALQSDSFSRNASLHDPFFSNLALDDKGRVSFDLSMNIDPEFLSYGNAVDAQVKNTALPEGAATATEVDAALLPEQPAAPTVQ